MKKIIATAIFLMSGNAFAADSWVGNVSIGVVSHRINSLVLFSVTGGVPSNICDHWGNQFYLDISTPGGKSLYTTIQAAKLSGTKINITYTNSTTPGVVNCAGETMAKPWVIDLL